MERPKVVGGRTFYLPPPEAFPPFNILDKTRSQVEVWWFLPADVWWFSPRTGSHLQSGEGRQNIGNQNTMWDHQYLSHTLGFSEEWLNCTCTRCKEAWQGGDMTLCVYWTWPDLYNKQGWIGSCGLTYRSRRGKILTQIIMYGGAGGPQDTLLTFGDDITFGDVLTYNSINVFKKLRIVGFDICRSLQYSKPHRTLSERLLQ